MFDTSLSDDLLCEIAEQEVLGNQRSQSSKQQTTKPDQKHKVQTLGVHVKRELTECSDLRKPENSDCAVESKKSRATFAIKAESLAVKKEIQDEEEAGKCTSAVSLSFQHNSLLRG